MTRAEWRYALLFGGGVMLLTCLPYLIVWALQPPGGVFQGLLFNSDDQSVYLAWMRQARDGHFFFRNLFTTEPQLGGTVHVYFWLLGSLCRLLPISLAAMLHVGRVVFGTLTLMLVYRFGCLFTEQVRVRRLILWMTTFSAGLGWIAVWRQSGAPTPERWLHLQPLDLWQTEMFTLPSLYVNGIFPISFALMLGILIFLVLAEERRQLRWAAAAGAAGLLLGNIHSYDVIILAAVWAAYLAGRALVARRDLGRALGAAVLAAAIALPAVLYQYWVLKHDPIFAARAAVPTLSRPLPLMLQGYGLLLPLMLVGLATLPWRAVRERPVLILASVWVVVGFAVPYLPVAFQRKLSMGLHFPVALLAALGLAATTAWLQRLRPRLRATPVWIAVLLLLTPTPAVWFYRDLDLAVGVNLTSTMTYPAWWPEDTVAAWRWLDGHLPADGATYVFPLRGLLLPEATGHPVVAGHWGETPHFSETVKAGRRFLRGELSPTESAAFLRERRATHLLISHAGRFVMRTARRDITAYPYLREVWRQGETVIYAVLPSDPSEQ